MNFVNEIIFYENVFFYFYIIFSINKKFYKLTMLND